MKCLTPLRIVAICGYFFMAFVALAQNAPNKQYAPHQLVLQLNKAIATEQAEATIAELLQGQVGKISPTHNPNLYVVALPDVLYLNEQRMADPAAIAQHFGEQPHPYLAFAEPNYRYDMATTPNDPGFAQQWSLFHPTNKHINAPDAWTMNHDCNDVVVGVIDSGIDWRHADLVDNIWQNMGEDADGDGHVLELVAGVWQFDPGDINNIDNDNNGYKDDFIGWDFVNNDNNPMDDNGHGTGMAGVIGAKANNAQGISGLCWTVKMMALKYLDSDGGGYTANATDAVRYATAMNATMTNNSWGGEGSSVALQNAIQDAATHNQLFVTSSGNNSVNIDTNPFYPANYPINNIVCVGASGVSGNLASFSSFGYNNVDLLAPGVDIYTTKPGNTYTSLNGTSLATALVTGVAALSYCNHPSYTDLKTHLLSSVDVQTNFDGICATSGRLNAFKARAIADCCSNNATFSASSSINCSGDQITFTNTSTNGSNYQWSVDGAVIPTYINPLLYNFSSGGTHTVALFSTNNGCTDATYQTINNIAPLNAGFTYYSNNFSVAFFVPAAIGVTYTWNFGDNSPMSNNSNAVHTYTAAGTYTVCLNVQNVCDTLQTCQDINVSLSTDCGNSAPPIEWQNTIGGSD
ncbi:MAG TPA: S8 family serine peptidase, partial [Chitinophagales bacterium]|nr:S8 family serine peptidase [Chitinophagales bacterium]